MATYETTSYAQMRRCRMAHLYGKTIDERFSEDVAGMAVGGYVHAIRPDFTRWPLSWSIIVEAEPVQSRVLAMAG